MRHRTRPLVTLTALVAAGLGLVVVPDAGAEDQRSPADLAADAVATAAGACDELDTRLCLLPFPNDRFTALDASTPTGRRVDLSPLATPRNVAGKPMDPTEWNRNDGFSPGSMILTVVPGLDLTTTFGLDPDPETGVGTDNDPFAVRDDLPDAVIEAPELSMAADAPIVLLDADTGERHPYWAELDEHAVTIEEGRDRTLIVRPLSNLLEGHRYIVALRDLRDASGAVLAATPAFVELLEGYQPPGAPNRRACEAAGGPARRALPPGCEDDAGPAFPPPADIDPADRAGRYQDIFTRLDASGVEVGDLHLAWDFHVASGDNLAGRALAIRDHAFGLLGDTVLDDRVPQGEAPTMTVTEVVDGQSDGAPTRTVHGTVTVPNYLTTPQDGIDPVALNAAEDVYDALPPELRDNDPGLGDGLGLAADVPVVAPQSRFVYDTPTPGPMDEPVQNPVVQTTQAEFTCKFRTDVGATKPTLYGHGLLGGRGEVEGGSTGDLRRGGHAMCGVDWIGMATEDITNVGLILHDISFFPSLADRAQQGFLNFLYVGRALVHPEGAFDDPAFQAPDGTPLLDPSELFYDGNSQGGIMGGALTALSPDFTRSVLGVPGINYSTLLNRSVDWEGEFIDPTDPGVPAYASFNYNMYPDKVQQQLVFALLQMLWDRAEGNGYAQHMTDQPYRNTPAHQVLLEVAFGDYQVTNHAAEVEARTIGADYLQTALAPGRHWERAVAAGSSPTPFGLQPFVETEEGLTAGSGSAIVYWDSGNPTPFNGNVPPAYLGQDPHGDPRGDDVALLQKLHFYATGRIVDFQGRTPNWTTQCPRHPEAGLAC
jgi:hypothetical protein